MKNIFVLLMLLGTYTASAQKAITGAWEGKLSSGGQSLRIVFHFIPTADGYSGTMDSPDQGANGLGVSNVLLRNDSLFADIPAARGKIRGAITDSTFTGEWSQGGSLPLLMMKVTETEVAGRAQEPRKPYPYNSKDVVYYNSNHTIQYGATLTTPQGNGPFATAILITGSGQQNRNEELMGHKPFLVLADYLTRQGYAVLRVDDRGMGQTTGDVANATSEDFAQDVEVSLAYLKTLAETDTTKLGLIGHSEGGMIAQMVAARHKEMAFVVSLAGPGEKIIDLMKDQSAAMLTLSGISVKAVEAYKPLYGQLVTALTTIEGTAEAKAAAMEKLNAWLAAMPSSLSKELFIEQTESAKQKTIDAMSSQVRSPWFRYFMRYNPAPYLQQMKCSVLVLNGGKDIQVAAGPNLAAWKTALQKSNVKKFEVVELKGLNHLFQHCVQCTVEEYATIEETFAPEALQVIGDWLKKNVQR